MNKFFKSAAIAAMTMAGAISASSCGTRPDIYGTLDDIADDSLMVYVFEPGRNAPVLIDTVVAENGNVAVNFKDTSFCWVYLLPLADQENGMSMPISFLPGDRVRISGSIYDPVCSGTEIYDGLSAFAGYKAFTDRLDSLYRKAENSDGNDIVGRQAINAEYEALMAEKDSIFTEYVRNHPNDLTSGYLVAYMGHEKGLEAYNLLGGKVRKSAMGKFLSDVASGFEATVQKEKNKKNIQPGKPAPDFSLKGLDGKDYTLASFKGKYVLLDFWGEWCYWCMKGMPEMKKYYDKYSDKIEFVGINCRDSEEVWKKTVEEEGLEWTNLYNGTGNEILNAYAVEGFPTKVLIDKEGKIVQVFVGESEELYNKLDELF